MNIIITGASSFIGLHLIDKLLQEDHCLFLLLHKGSSRNMYVPLLANVYKFYDIEDFPKDVVYDACFHLAWGYTKSEFRDDIEKHKENFELSMKIFQWCEQNGVNKFIFFGSQAEIFSKSQYGIRKKEFADYCINNKRNISFIHLRIFSIYGPGDFPLSLVNYCIDCLLDNVKAILGPCTHKWNYLFIDDLINILYKILIKVEKDVLYDIGSHISQELKKYVLQITENVSFGERKNNTEGAVDLIPDLTILINDIGEFSETTFEEGIEITKKYRMLRRE